MQIHSCSAKQIIYSACNMITRLARCLRLHLPHPHSDKQLYLQRCTLRILEVIDNPQKWKSSDTSLLTVPGSGVKRKNSEMKHLCPLPLVPQTIKRCFFTDFYRWRQPHSGTRQGKCWQWRAAEVWVRLEQCSYVSVKLQWEHITQISPIL